MTSYQVEHKPVSSSSLVLQLSKQLRAIFTIATGGSVYLSAMQNDSSIMGHSFQAARALKEFNLYVLPLGPGPTHETHKEELFKIVVLNYLPDHLCETF